MIRPPSCHQPHKELLQIRDVGGSADSRLFQLSTISSLYSQRRNEFAGEGSGEGVGISRDVERLRRWRRRRCGDS